LKTASIISVAIQRAEKGIVFPDYVTKKAKDFITPSENRVCRTIVRNWEKTMFYTNRSMTMQLLEKALNTESIRRNVLANNIANVDVPHFKRSEVNFESELKRAIDDKNESNKTMQAIMTDPRHIPFYIPRDIAAVQPRINLDYNTSYRNDGNNVDIEKEMVDASKNTMRYNAYSQRIGSAFSNLKRVIQMA